MNVCVRPGLIKWGEMRSEEQLQVGVITQYVNSFGWKVGIGVPPVCGSSAPLCHYRRTEP